MQFMQANSCKHLLIRANLALLALCGYKPETKSDMNFAIHRSKVRKMENLQKFSFKLNNFSRFLPQASLRTRQCVLCVNTELLLVSTENRNTNRSCGSATALMQEETEQYPNLIPPAPSPYSPRPVQAFYASWVP